MGKLSEWALVAEEKGIRGESYSLLLSSSPRKCLKEARGGEQEVFARLARHHIYCLNSNFDAPL